MTPRLAAAAALGAAILYATASVLQHREAALQPGERSLRLGLLVQLAARPLWLAGNVADLAGYALQFLALSSGSIILVQPILVSGLVFALPLSALVDRRRVSRREACGAAAVAAGIALFLAVARPADPRGRTDAAHWAMAMGGCLGASALALLASRRARPPIRAALLGTGAGLLFGLTAALTEATGHLLHLGAGHLVRGWQPYVLAVVGTVNLILAQSAFQAGPLAWSLPSLTVAETLASVAIGAFAFGEDLSTGTRAVSLELLGLLAVGLGVLVIAIASGRPRQPVGSDAGA